MMDDRLLRDIAILQELMQEGGWRSIAVRGANLSLALSDLPTDPWPPMAPVPAGVRAPAAPAPASASFAPMATTIDPAWTVITAPNLGTFYRSPKPGAPTFVELGQVVSAGEELCLIEVMKLFTSVRAASAGIVRHIAVDDGQLVEGGQALIYLECN